MARAFLPLWKNRCYIIFCWLILTGVTVYREIKQDSHTKHYQSEKRLEATRRIWNNVLRYISESKRHSMLSMCPCWEGPAPEHLELTRLMFITFYMCRDFVWLEQMNFLKAGLCMANCRHIKCKFNISFIYTGKPRLSAPRRAVLQALVDCQRPLSTR